MEVVWKVIDSVSVHAKRMQANGGVNSYKSKTPDHKTQEGSSKTGGSSKGLGLPTERQMYTDKHTHTPPTTGFSYIFFKKGFIYRILNFAIKFDPFGAKPDLFRDLGPLAGPLCTLEFLLQNVSCHRNP